MRPLDAELCCRHQAHQLGESLLMNGSALLKGKGLVAVGLGVEKGTHLVEQVAEARRRGAMFESAHRPIPLFDAAMILVQLIIQVVVRPVSHPLSKDVPNGTRIGIVAIRGDAVWDHPGCSLLIPSSLYHRQP